MRKTRRRFDWQMGIGVIENHISRYNDFSIVVLALVSLMIKTVTKKGALNGSQLKFMIIRVLNI